MAGFRRARLAATGSIMTITIALLLLGLFYIISTQTSRIIDSLRNRVDMEVFLDEPISRQRITDIQQQILSLDGVERVQFISKDEAARIFKEEFGEDITKVLDFNPLPPSFKIFLREEFRTTEKAADINRRIKDTRGIKDVVYRRDLLEFLDRRTRVLYNVGLALGVIIGISAIFLVSNTIRLTIYAKRKTIQTMKLVGAPRWFIRAPFLIEGMLQGIVGGILAMGIHYYLITFAVGLVSDDLAQYVHVDTVFYVFVVAAGAFLGFFGSVISVRRFIGEAVVG